MNPTAFFGKIGIAFERFLLVGGTGTWFGYHDPYHARSIPNLNELHRAGLAKTSSVIHDMSPSLSLAAKLTQWSLTGLQQQQNTIHVPVDLC